MIRSLRAEKKGERFSYFLARKNLSTDRNLKYKPSISLYLYNKYKYNVEDDGYLLRFPKILSIFIILNDCW